MICAGEERFADACIELWKNAELRGTQGVAARTTVVGEVSDTWYQGEVVRIVEDVLAAKR